MIKHRLTLIVSGLLLAALITGCAVNPVTGRNELSLLDETQEINLGTNQYGPTQQSQGGPYTADPELSEYVSKVGQRLARVSDRSLPYEFVIIDDSTPNAWALPGGKIGINRGLLVRLNSEAELAAVLSHEIVHAAARHSAKSIERGLLVDGVLNAAEPPRIKQCKLRRYCSRRCSPRLTNALAVLRPGGGIRIGCLRHDLYASCWL